jgi:hypothetical protein
MLIFSLLCRRAFRSQTLVVALLWSLWPTVSLAQPYVFGYVAWWVPQALTIQSLPDVDRLKFMEFRIGPDGRIQDRHGWPGEWGALREAAAVHGIPIDMVFTLFSPAEFNALFGSAERVQRLQKEVLTVAADPSITGIHLDVEIFSAVNAKAAARYRAFVVELGLQLKAMTPRKSLSLFLNYAADKYLYDAPTLVDVDHVILQGYDAHWLDSEVAGPLAPLAGPDIVTWEKMWATAQGLGLSGNRVLMGFPTYGHEWKVKPCDPRGKRVAPGEATVFGRVWLPNAPNLRNSAMGRVLAHGATYDPISGSAYYQVNASDGSCVVGWFEDWWTLQRKMDWVMKEKLAGIAFFPLGYDDGDLVSTAAHRFRAAGRAAAKATAP